MGGTNDPCPLCRAFYERIEAGEERLAARLFSHPRCATRSILLGDHHEPSINGRCWSCVEWEGRREKVTRLVGTR